jgi:peptide/nickel transport system substrate-binding protein
MKIQRDTSTYRELDALSRRRGMSRREFMGRAAALGVLPIAAQLWATGAEAQTPVKGGLLRIALDGGSTSDSLDPNLFTGGNFPATLYHAVYDLLVQIGPDGGPAPMLAETWEPNDDLTVWRLGLRKGVTFHDGRPFTARDVAYSIGYLATEGSANGAVKRNMEKIVETKIEDDHTIILTLSAPNIDFPTVLSLRGTFIIPDGTTDFTNAVGTGPYAVESFEPGTRASLKKYDAFWTDQDGHFDEIRLLAISDAATRTNAVMNGDVDLANSPEVSTVQRLASVSGIEIFKADGGQHFTTAMNASMAPFDNPDVRLAIKHGVRRQEFVDKVLGGFGYLGNDNPIGRNYKYFNDSIPQREFDPERAKYHWEKAELGNAGLKLYASEGAYSGSVAAAQLVQASLSEVGIPIEVEAASGDGYWSDVWLKVPWCSVYWNGNATAGAQLSYYTTGNGYNDVSFNNARFDELLASAAKERDETLRGEMYGEAQQIFHDEAGTVVLGFNSYVSAGSSKLGHGKIGTITSLDDFLVTRRWWWKEA